MAKASPSRSVTKVAVTEVQFGPGVLVEARLARGLTATDLAVRLAIHASALSRWENGSAVRARHAVRLMEELGLDPEFVLVRS